MNKISALLPFKKHFSPVCYRLIFRPEIICTSSALFHQHLLRENLYENKYQENSRFYSSVALDNENFFKRLKRKVKNSLSDKTKTRIGGTLVYEHCADKIDHVEFIKYFNLPDTFQSWFFSIQLHVWMCILVTLCEKNGRLFRNTVVETMWNDVETRMSHVTTLASSDKKKHLREFVSQFQTALVAFDEGILSEDTVLAAAVWRSIFCFKLVDPELLEKVVMYIRQQVHHLDSLNTEKIILEGVISFLPLSDIFPDVKAKSV